MIARATLPQEPDYKRLLMGSPLLRRRSVCLLLCSALLALLVFAVLVHLSMLVGMRADVASVFFRALAGSTVLATVPLAILWFLDRRERESPWLFAAAFLWGACIATSLSLPFNTAFFKLVDDWVAENREIAELLGPDATMILAAPISAPIAEEIAKALGVALVFWLLRAEFDNMRDGIVYGALIGVGFNWFEAAVYVAQNYAEYGVAPYGLHLGARYALFGLGGHAMFTAIFGASLGLAVQTRRRWLRLLTPIGGLALAVGSHMLNNALPLIDALASAAAGEPPREWQVAPDTGFVEAFLTGSLVQLTIFLPFVGLAGLAIWRSGVWERRVIREELAGEVGRTVTGGEYQDVLRDRMLRTRRIDAARPNKSAALVNAQHELAFRKRRVREEGNDPERDPLVAGWRKDINRLRAAA